jgi:hypothetical protein
MERREFLTGGSLLAGGAISSIPVLSRSKTTAETLTVSLYMTEFAEEKAPTDFQTQLELYLQETFGNQLGLSVSVIYEGSVSVSISEHLNKDNKQKAHRKWKDYHQKHYNHSTSNSYILVDASASPTNSGYADIPLLSSCCRSQSLYGVASAGGVNGIINMFEQATENILQLVAHEIGHTIGLLHCYGRTHPEKVGHSIMLSDTYAKQYPRNIFGEPISYEARDLKYVNPKISQKHTVLS